MAYVIRIIPAIIFFSKLGLPRYLWTENVQELCKTGTVKTRKVKEVAENDNKVILCNVLETT